MTQELERPQRRYTLRKGKYELEITKDPTGQLFAPGTQPARLDVLIARDEGLARVASRGDNELAKMLHELLQQLQTQIPEGSYVTNAELAAAAAEEFDLPWIRDYTIENICADKGGKMPKADVAIRAEQEMRYLQADKLEEKSEPEYRSFLARLIDANDPYGQQLFNIARENRFSVHLRNIVKAIIALPLHEELREILFQETRRVLIERIPTLKKRKESVTHQRFRSYLKQMRITNRAGVRRYPKSLRGRTLGVQILERVVERIEQMDPKTIATFTVLDQLVLDGLRQFKTYEQIEAEVESVILLAHGFSLEESDDEQPDPSVEAYFPLYVDTIVAMVHMLMGEQPDTRN